MREVEVLLKEGIPLISHHELRNSVPETLTTDYMGGNDSDILWTHFVFNFRKCDSEVFKRVVRCSFELH